MSPRWSGLRIVQEREWLAQRPPNFLEEGLPGRGGRQYGEDYARAESGLGDELAKHKDAGTRLFLLASSAVVEIGPNVVAALERADLPESEIGQLLAKPIDFIAALPTRQAVLELRLERHRDRAAAWDANDMHDIAYLACATVHCDVVVTERQWRHRLAVGGLARKYGTTVLSDIADLPDLLAGGKLVGA